MKFRNYGLPLLATLATLAATIGVTACKQNYTTGYLYVTGTQINSNTGQIGAFKINSTNGKLYNIPGQPFSSGGSNPVRALVETSGRYLFALNQGVASTNASTGNTTYNGNGIAAFSIGGSGTLSYQRTYQSSGFGAERILEYSGQYIYVLDEYEPAYATAADGSNPALTNGIPEADLNPADSANFPCIDANNIAHPVGAITAYRVDPTTGILTLVQNSQQSNTTYFPVGCFPVDMHVASGYLYVMDKGSQSNNDVETVYPYAISSSTGALTQTSNGPYVTGASNVTMIGGDNSGSYIVLLDAGTNEIYMYSPGTSGSLQPISGSPFANDSNVANPDALLFDSNTHFLYIANASSSSTLNSGNGAISYFTLNPTSHVLSETPGSPTGTGSGPVCIVEDPTNQFIYTADHISSTVTGHLYNPNTGVLSNLRTTTQYSTVGNPTWCMVDSHTD